jgi:hypothetical protein
MNFIPWNILQYVIQRLNIAFLKTEFWKIVFLEGVSTSGFILYFS